MEVTVEGEPDAQTGYLCDIRELDQAVRQAGIPTLESLLRFDPRIAPEQLLESVWEPIAQQIRAQVSLVELTLAVSPYRRYRVHKENWAVVELTEQFEFSASHRLHAVGLSDERNRELFGKCNNPNGHGHNYLVDVTIAGESDQKTGVLLPPGALAEVVHQHVIEYLDHKHLNADVAEFQSMNPSVENIARVIWDRLIDRLAPARLVRVRVYETAKTWVDIDADLVRESLSATKGDAR